MANPNLSRLITDVWEQTARETENPFVDTRGMFNSLLGLPPVLYREYLDRHRVNMNGEVIPRITVVRRHLRQLGNIRLNPNRLR